MSWDPKDNEDIISGIVAISMISRGRIIDQITEYKSTFPGITTIGAVVLVAQELNYCVFNNQKLESQSG